MTAAEEDIGTLPLRDCFEVHYARVAVVVLLFMYGADLEPGTRIPLLALAAAGGYGIKAAFGGRRHRLKFKMSDGTTLSWQSRAGERELMQSNVDAIVEFARSKGLATS